MIISPDVAANFSAFAQAAAPLAVTALWQGMLVAAAMTVALRIAPRVSASQRFLAWSAGFAAVAALPFLPAAARVFAGLMPGSAELPSSSLAGAAAASSHGPHPPFAIGTQWALAIAAIWIAFSAYRMFRLIAHVVHLRSLWKSAEVLPESARAGVSAAEGVAELCSTQALDRPSVIGFFRPRILIPAWLFDRLTASELNQVILHEAEHLRRHDDWTNLLQKICLVVFPLNPALLWIDARLGHEREIACDEGVVRRTHAPRAYAACLASLAERGLQRKAEGQHSALSLAAWRRRSELVHRVQSILRRKSTLHPAWSAVLLGIFGVGLSAASVELASCPQMVAFVAPQPAAMASLAPVPDATNLIRASIPASAGYRAVAAKAIVSGNPNAPAVYGDAPKIRAAREQTPVAARESASLNRTASHAQNVRASMPSTGAVQDQNAPEEFVVFTAMEPIEPARRHQHVIYDYERSDMSEVNAPTQVVIPEFAVTRLVFKIDATNMNTSANTNAKSKPSQSIAPDSVQPVAVPFGNGWLVFQL